MAAGRHDLVIEKGAVFTRTFRLLDSASEVIDLTGQEARFTIRAPDALGDIVIDLLSEDSPAEITIDGPAGEITVDLDALRTTEEPEDTCNGWYTLKRWPAGEPERAKRVVEGRIRWSPESSRDDESGS